MNIIRVWFSKKGSASFISHLDLQRVMHRVLRKAKIPAWYSQGFNPHIYLTFALPLPLGQESVCEYLDFRIENENPDLDQVYYGMKDILPQGIDVYNVSIAKYKAGDIGFSRYIITFPDEIKEDAIKAVNAFNNIETAITHKIGKKNGRKGVEKELDLKNHIKTLNVYGSSDTYCLDVLLPAGTVTINPALILGFLKDTYGLDITHVNVCRTQVLTNNLEKFE